MDLFVVNVKFCAIAIVFVIKNHKTDTLTGIKRPAAVKTATAGKIDGEIVAVAFAGPSADAGFNIKAGAATKKESIGSFFINTIVVCNGDSASVFTNFTKVLASGKCLTGCG